MAVRHGVIPDGDLRIGFGVRDHTLLGKLRHLTSPGLLGRRTTRNAPEIPFSQRHGCLWVEVANQRRGQIVWRVVLVEEGQGLFACHPLEVAWPADDRPAIG